MPSYGTGFGIYKDASGGGAPPVGTGGIYGGNGNVPLSTVATIGDTLTFAGGNMVMGASANLLVGLNEIQLVADKIYNDGTALLLEGHTGGIAMVDDSGATMEWSGGLGLTLLTNSGGSLWLDVTTTDSIFHFTQANGTAFDGKLGVISGLMANRTWRLPDASGTIALEGGGGIYDGSGNVPMGVVATIFDTLTFSGGDVIIDGTDKLGFGGGIVDAIYKDGSGILQIESSGNTNFEVGGDLTTNADGIQFNTGLSFLTILTSTVPTGSNKTATLQNASGTIAYLTDTFYGTDGTLSSARSVDMDSLSLGFTNAAAGFSIGTATADATAILDLDVTTLGASAKKGFLPPRMTEADMLSIATGTPATGLMVYDTTNNQWMGYNGTSWVILG